jgi:drug/metabolite transporter (DMT)-like permease
MKSLLSRLRRLTPGRAIPTACVMGCILSPLRGYASASSAFISAQRGTSSSALHPVLYTWGAILAIVFASVVGDVLLAHAMKQVGDVGELRRREGLIAVIRRTLGNTNFFLGVTAMAVAFFSLLFALSWGDVSLVAPAAASLTFIGNAVAAKIFLHERVDRRRWIAASLVAAGVALLAG